MIPEQWVRAAAAAVIASALAACGGGDDDEQLAGPCVVKPSEPALILSAARSASAPAGAIPVVTLSDITIDGVAFSTSIPFQNVATNVRVVGSAVECTIPCGFSDREGAYAFTASAPGFAASSVRVAASYSARAGSCPLVLSGGTRYELFLSR